MLLTFRSCAVSQAASYDKSSMGDEAVREAVHPYLTVLKLRPHSLVVGRMATFVHHKCPFELDDHRAILIEPKRLDRHDPHVRPRM